MEKNVDTSCSNTFYLYKTRVIILQKMPAIKKKIKTKNRVLKFSFVCCIINIAKFSAIDDHVGCSEKRPQIIQKYTWVGTSNSVCLVDL